MFLEESNEKNGKVQEKVRHVAVLAHAEGHIQYCKDDTSFYIKNTLIANKEEIF